MDAIVKFLRPIFSRVVGSWVAGIALWIGAHYGVVLDDNTQAQIVAGSVALTFALGQTIYALVHRAIDVHANPKDSASPTLAEKKS